MSSEPDRRIRVVVFAGPYLHPAAVEFVARLQGHADIELLQVLCEGPGPGLRHRITNLWRRRRLMALPVLAVEFAQWSVRWLSKPRAMRRLHRQARSAMAKCVTKPNVHAADVLDSLRALDPELGLVYGAPILRPEVFQIPRYGTLGIHHGRVPHYRGKKTTFWEMYCGEEVAGVTIQRLNAGIDTGDIARTGAVSIGRKSYARVERETELLGYDLYIEAILDVKRGTASYAPQDPATMTLKKFRQPGPADVARFVLRRLARVLDSSTAADRPERRSRV